MGPTGHDAAKRTFLGLAAGALIAPLPAVSRGALAQSSTGNPRVMDGPMIGAVTPSSALIWARTSGAHAVSVSFADNPALSGARTTAAQAATADADYTVRIALDGLKPASTYYCRVLIDGRPDPYLAQFDPIAVRTAPPDGWRGRFRIAFGSCARVGHDREQPIWRTVDDLRPDLFFWLGDNVYVDSLNPATFGEEYRRQRGVALLQPVLRSVPQLAIWDDHDYGLNNHDRTNPIKDTALAAFKQYWANPAYGLPDAPGVFFSYRYGGIDFFFLDDRWWRDPNAAPDGPAKTMLGARQLAWLKDGLKASRAPFKLLISGSGWSLAKGPGEDAWSAFMSERDALFDFIRDEKISGVVLLSGDTHVGELNCIPWSDRGGYDFYDLVSSPLAQRTENSWIERRPEIRVRQAFFHDANTGVIDIDTTGSDPSLTFNLYDTRGRPAWRVFTLTAADLTPGVQSWTRLIDRTSKERHDRWKAGGSYY
ncbi:MAG: alkaline phosphatase D family protein [Rhodospirillaceae bacterium]|nr:alkaline phosphatase D family protein [Rhodospirillaceae bacterium]